VCVCLCLCVSVCLCVWVRECGVPLLTDGQRVVHLDDIVPHYPFVDMGYHHVPTEVWQTGNASHTVYTVCDGSGEDPHCSNAVPARKWSPSDHDTYMNIHNDGCSKTP
jgi:hypothetical protein